MTATIYSTARDLYALAPAERYPCCVWVAEVLIRSADLAGRSDFGRGSPWWQRANVSNSSQPWSSTAAAAELRRAAGWPESVLRRVHSESADRRLEVVRDGLTPGSWHVVQGWRSLDPLEGGHTWLWWADPTDPELGVCLESSEAKGVRTSGVPGVPPWESARREHLAPRIARYAAGISVVAVGA